MLDETETSFLETESVITHPPVTRLAKARSEIVFPYTHLEDAESVARAILQNGISLSRDQIAGVMGCPPTSGGFALKIGAARTFRIIEGVEGKYQLSELGVRILSSDESELRNARREAFLNVELYQKTFETFRNRPLPSRPDGLEAAFVQFGVAPKQKDKARLAFERSAQLAGFFSAGRERLVEPIVSAALSSSSRLTAREIHPQSGKDAAIDSPLPIAAQELLIKGLLDRLPSPGHDWPVHERARWLRAFAVNLSIIYGAEEEAAIEITVPSRAAALLQKATVLQPSVRVSAVPAKALEIVEPPKTCNLDDEIPF